MTCEEKRMNYEQLSERLKAWADTEHRGSRSTTSAMLYDAQAVVERVKVLELENDRLNTEAEANIAVNRTQFDELNRLRAELARIEETEAGYDYEELRACRARTLRQRNHLAGALSEATGQPVVIDGEVFGAEFVGKPPPVSFTRPELVERLGKVREGWSLVNGHFCYQRERVWEALGLTEDDFREERGHE